MANSHENVASSNGLDDKDVPEISPGTEENGVKVKPRAISNTSQSEKENSKPRKISCRLFCCASGQDVPDRNTKCVANPSMKYNHPQGSYVITAPKAIKQLFQSVESRKSAEASSQESGTEEIKTKGSENSNTEILHKNYPLPPQTASSRQLSRIGNVGGRSSHTRQESLLDGAQRPSTPESVMKMPKLPLNAEIVFYYLPGGAIKRVLRVAKPRPSEPAESLPATVPAAQPRPESLPMASYQQPPMLSSATPDQQRTSAKDLSEVKKPKITKQNKVSPEPIVGITPTPSPVLASPFVRSSVSIGIMEDEDGDAFAPLDEMRSFCTMGNSLLTSVFTKAKATGQALKTTVVKAKISVDQVAKRSSSTMKATVDKAKATVDKAISKNNVRGSLGKAKNNVRGSLGKAKTTAKAVIMKSRPKLKESSNPFGQIDIDPNAESAGTSQICDWTDLRQTPNYDELREQSAKLREQMLALVGQPTGILTLESLSVPTTQPPTPR